MSEVIDKELADNQEDKTELIFQIQSICLNLNKLELTKCTSLADAKLIDGRYLTTSRLMKLPIEKLSTILKNLRDRKLEIEDS